MAVTLKGQSAIYEGTSADMKPSDADKNAIFQELDTGIDYYYDGTNWNEIPSSGGGGGGTGTDNYNDLNNKPSINGTTLSGNKSLDNLGIQAKLTFDSAPTEDSENPVTSGGVYTALATNIQGIKVNGSTVNPDSNKVVNITVPTSAADVSALPDTTKYAAALKLTINSSTFVMTGQLKDQDGNNLGTAQTIDLPLESVVVGGSYNSQTKKVVLTLQNGNTIEFSVADLVSGLQTELSASNKLNPAYINYDSTHRAVSDTEKSTWNGKQNALSSTQLAAVNSGIDSTKVAQIKTNKNNILYNTENGVANIMPVQTSLNKSDSGLLYSIVGDKYILSGSRTIAASYYIVTDNIVLNPNTDYTIYIDHQNNTTTTQLQIVARNGSTWVDILGGTTTGTSTISSSNYVKFMVRLLPNVTEGSAVDDTVRIMITPKSLGITSYQPYAISNAELTAKEQANESNISTLMMSGAERTADLNKIAVNDFGVYTNNSSNLPSADYCFVRTSVNPEAPTTSRLQEAFVMSTGVSYIRTMGGGEWHNWLQITNA